MSWMAAAARTRLALGAYLAVEQLKEVLDGSSARFDEGDATATSLGQLSFVSHVTYYL